MNIVFRIVVFFVFVLTVNILQAQDDDCPTYKNRKADEKYNETLLYYKTNPNEAIAILEEIANQDAKHIDSHYMLAVLYFEKVEQLRKQKTQDTVQIDNYLKKSLKEHRKVVKLCDQYQDYESHFYIAQILYQQRNFAEAKPSLDHYIDRTKRFVRRKEAELMRDNVNEYLRLVENPVPFQPHALLGVNTLLDEYLPLLSPDDSYLYYTQRKFSDSKNYTETFLFSKKRSPKGELEPDYTVGEKMPLPFNDGRNQGAASLTVDNRTLYMSVCGIERGSYTSYQNCDIYVSTRLKGEWTSLQRLSSAINGSMTYESQPSITADGRTLYFASIRDGGFGKLDIYCSAKDENGKWKPAINLGPAINTAGDDYTPFIHPDGKTLYFSSNGRFGVGNSDIFVSRYDSVSGWSKPQNIGYPINTEHDEVAFSVSTDGNRIYFASDKLSKKDNYDIYSTPTPETAKPGKVLLVKGRVIGDDGDTLSHVRIMVQNTRTKTTAQGIVEDSTGRYAVSLPVEMNDNYILTAEKHGYVYFSELINPNATEYIPPTTLDIEVRKLRRGKTYILESVFFDTDSYELTENTKIGLQTVARMMEEHPQFSFEIHGHTDSQGGGTHNFSLSYNRAKAVYDYLVSLGIDSARLDFKAFGESKPVDSNTTQVGRSQNRRVEVLVK